MERKNAIKHSCLRLARGNSDQLCSHLSESHRSVLCQVLHFGNTSDLFVSLKGMKLMMLIKADCSAFPRINSGDISASHHTLPLRTVTCYERKPIQVTKLMHIGPHAVLTEPLLGTTHTRYLILDGKEIVRELISYPSENDCECAIRQHRDKKNSTVTQPVNCMSKPKSRAFKIKRVTWQD